MFKGSFTNSRGLAAPWVCSRCLSKLQTPRPAGTRARDVHYRSPRTFRPTQIRCYQTRSAIRASALDANRTPAGDPYFDTLISQGRHEGGIRKQLSDWQQQHGTPNADIPPPFERDAASEVVNDSMRTAGFAEDVPQPNDPEDNPSQQFAAANDFNGVEYEYLAPGDLVVLHFPLREPEVGVFVREFDHKSQIFLMSGKWLHIWSASKVPFTVPGFIKPALLDKITPYLPQHESTDELVRQATIDQVDLGVPREAAAPIITKLIAFWDESEAVYRRHAAALDSAHEILAHPTELRFGTLARIAKQLLGRGTKVTDAALFAVRRALSRSAGFTFDKKSHRFTRVYMIQPRDYLLEAAKAADWIRQYQDFQAGKASDMQGPHDDGLKSRQPMPAAVLHVERFIEHAKRLIQQSRKIRPYRELSIVSPSVVQHTITQESDAYRLIESSKFSDSEQVINRFLTSICLGRDFEAHVEYLTLAGVLFRAVQAYPDPTKLVNRAAVYKMLQEMGVIKPYENPVLHNTHLLLPSSPRSQPLKRLRDAISEPEEGAHFPDTMSDLRHDWGDLQVFCIDKSGSRNIDDGVSVENVPGKRDEWWVRIHIANPTALIAKDHPVARMAAHMTQNFYAPDDHNHLLPSWITQQFISLAPDRPVLTVSARLDKDGHVLERDIRPGIVRKVQKITPEAVSQILGLRGDSAPKNSLLVGASPAILERFHRKEELPNLTHFQKDLLRSLLDIAQRRLRLRRSNKGMSTAFPDPSVYVSNHMRLLPMPSQLPIFTDRAHFFQGDPMIHLQSETFTGYSDQVAPDASYLIVQEMMLVAGEAAAQWCSERNIPIIYRGFYDVWKSPDKLSADDFFERQLKPRLDENSKIPHHLLFAWMRLVGRSGTALTPLKHPITGLKSYAKVTTPMGRYADMIAHWQIESAIREEARIGTSLVGSSREDYLAFTRAELTPIMPRLRAREALLRKSTEHCEDHWVHILYSRAFDFGEAELPETMECVINYGTDPAGFAIGLIKNFCTSVRIILPPEDTMPPGCTSFARPGDHWEVKLSKVSVVPREIEVEPVRLLHREPFHIEHLTRHHAA